jgi:hypothetical protein
LYRGGKRRHQRHERCGLSSLHGRAAIDAATLDDQAQAQRYVEEWKSIRAQTMLRVDQVLVEVEKRAQLA